MAVNHSTSYSKIHFLLFVVVHIGATQKLIANPSRALEKLSSETIYVLPPPFTSAETIRASFGENYKMLDTLAATVNKNVHRIAIDEKHFGKLPFILKYYPSVQQLFLNEFQQEIPLIIGNFKNLLSLRIEHTFFDSILRRYAYDDFPVAYVNYNLPRILTQLPKLEQLA